MYVYIMCVGMCILFMYVSVYIFDVYIYHMCVLFENFPECLEDFGGDKEVKTEECFHNLFRNLVFQIGVTDVTLNTNFRFRLVKFPTLNLRTPCTVPFNVALFF